MIAAGSAAWPCLLADSTTCAGFVKLAAATASGNDRDASWTHVGGSCRTAALWCFLGLPLLARSCLPAGFAGNAACAGVACSCRAWVEVPVLLGVADLPRCCSSLAVVKAGGAADAAGSDGSAVDAVTGAGLDSGSCAATGAL